MPKRLSREALDSYRREGFHFPLRAFPAEEALRFRGCLEAHEAASGKPLQGKWRVKTHLLFTWACEIVDHPAILDAVEDVIGPDILCWGSNFFLKEAGSPGFVSWHQDAAYWGLEPHEVVTAWVALSESSVESGCMKVIPGTHAGAIAAHVDTFHENNLLTRGQEIAVEVDEGQQPPRAGDDDQGTRDPEDRDRRQRPPEVGLVGMNGRHVAELAMALALGRRQLEPA